MVFFLPAISLSMYLRYFNAKHQQPGKTIDFTTIKYNNRSRWNLFHHKYLYFIWFLLINLDDLDIWKISNKFMMAILI